MQLNDAINAHDILNGKTLAERVCPLTGDKIPSGTPVWVSGVRGGAAGMYDVIPENGEWVIFRRLVMGGGTWVYAFTLGTIPQGDKCRPHMKFITEREPS